MAIRTNSRYEASTVDYFKKEENGQVYPAMFYEFDSLKNIKYFYHTYTTGETLQGIANRYLNTHSLWWTIAEYNPEITDLLHIPDGTKLRIPARA